MVTFAKSIIATNVQTSMSASARCLQYGSITHRMAACTWEADSLHWRMRYVVMNGVCTYMCSRCNLYLCTRSFPFSIQSPAKSAFTSRNRLCRLGPGQPGRPSRSPQNSPNDDKDNGFLRYKPGGWRSRPGHQTDAGPHRAHL